MYIFEMDLRRKDSVKNQIGIQNQLPAWDEADASSAEEADACS